MKCTPTGGNADAAIPTIARQGQWGTWRWDCTSREYADASCVCVWGCRTLLRLAQHLEAECVQHRGEAELISGQHEYRREPYLAGVQHAGDDIGGDHEIQVVAITDFDSSPLGLSDRSEGLRILVHF